MTFLFTSLCLIVFEDIISHLASALNGPTDRGCFAVGGVVRDVVSQDRCSVERVTLEMVAAAVVFLDELELLACGPTGVWRVVVLVGVETHLLIHLVVCLYTPPVWGHLPLDLPL